MGHKMEYCFTNLFFFDRGDPRWGPRKEWVWTILGWIIEGGVPVSWFLVADCVIQGVHAEATYNKGSGMFRFYCNLILFVMFPDFRHDKMPTTPACPHAYSPFFKVWWWEWEHELRLSVPLGGKSNFHPAVWRHNVRRLHRGPKVGGSVWAEPRAGGASSRLLHSCAVGGLQPCRAHCGGLHWSWTGSFTGWVVWGCSRDQRWHHQTLRCSRFGLDAEWECHREVWHAHPVDVTSASGQDLRPSATFCDLQRPIDGLVMTGHWSVLHHPFLGTLMLCIPTEWKTRCCAVPIAFCQGFFRCGENWKNYHPVNLREPIP